MELKRLKQYFTIVPCPSFWCQRTTILLIDRAESNHILAYLVKPIKQADLEPAISIAVRRFRQFQAVHEEAASLRQRAGGSKDHRAGQRYFDETR